MFEIQKKVLKGVSNDQEFFKKELIKSHAWLNSMELKQLKEWVMKEFYHLYPDTINEVFQSEYDYV